jgi:SAM-dependent methyltransferase
LRRHARDTGASVLDAPCGGGRLFAALAGRGASVTGLDVSAAMLEAARDSGRPLVRGDVTRLPFLDASFDHVVCCRLLHHLHTRDERLAVARELVRVARSLVIASFWDAASLPALRRRLGWKRSEGPHGRVAVSRAHLLEVFRAAGAEVIDVRHAFPLVSQQAFLVARKRAPGA